MAAMTKRVNIKTTIAVRNTTPPVCGTYKDIVMTTGDILKCLCKRAVVEEILPDGSIIRLNMKNYYTDNGAGLDAKPTKVNTIVNTEPAVEEEKINEKPAVDITVMPEDKNIEEELNQSSEDLEEVNNMNIAQDVVLNDESASDNDSLNEYADVDTTAEYSENEQTAEYETKKKN